MNKFHNGQTTEISRELKKIIADTT